MKGRFRPAPVRLAHLDFAAVDPQTAACIAGDARVSSAVSFPSELSVPESVVRHDAAPVLRTEMLTDPEAVWALRPAWEALWRRAEGGFALAFVTCFSVWHEMLAPTGATLRVIACYEDDALVALWPLICRRRAKLWRVLYPMGVRMGEFCDVLVEDTSRAALHVEAVWQCLRTSGGADIAILSYVRKSSPLGRLLDARGVRGSEPDIGPYVAWRTGESWDAYYATLSKSARHEHRVKRRQLQAMGAMTFEALREPERMAGLIRWTLAQKRSWAEHAGKNGPWLYWRSYEAFLVRLVTEPTDRAAPVVFRLAIDGETVATLLAIEGERHIDWITSGFSAALRHRSPGIVLNEACMRDAYDRGLVVELGVGFGGHKALWSRGSRHETLTYRVAFTAWGLLGVRVITARLRLGDWLAARRVAAAQTPKSA
jgi:CelD/BcsL family acetyltransferase involved in cellulose biosynthesis